MTIFLFPTTTAALDWAERACAESPMDEQRKHAYRYLLYRAMLDIRPLAWVKRSWNPLAWGQTRRRIRCAGAIAEWLHNLALFSVLDFARFDEERFWRDYQWMLDRNPEFGLERYRTECERRITPSGEQSFLPV